MEKDLLSRIKKLEDEMASLKRSSTIPLEIDQAFENRGFSKQKIVFGTTTIGIGGFGLVPMPLANKNSIPLVTYSSSGAFPAEANIIDSATGIGYDLYIVATALDTINYAVLI